MEETKPQLNLDILEQMEQLDKIIDTAKDKRFSKQAPNIYETARFGFL
jgi:hypothetical protein